MENSGAVLRRGAVPGESLVLSNGAVPGESAVLSNGAVPGESAVLRQGAVPGESAVPSIAVPSESLDLSNAAPSGDVAAGVASESGEPGASRTRATNHGSAREFHTPPLLQKLAPPHCTCTLDHRAHRFLFKFRKEGNVWKDHYKHPLEMSKAFINFPWRDALTEVHRGAWDRWNVVKEEAGWKISDPSHVQTPGCIPDDMLEQLADIIQSMPRPIKYPMTPVGI